MATSNIKQIASALGNLRGFVNLGLKSNPDVSYTDLQDYGSQYRVGVLIPYVFAYSSSETHLVIGYSYYNASYGAQLWFSCGNSVNLKYRKCVNGTWSSWGELVNT